MWHIKHIHLVGVGGSGMAGIAEVLLNLGYVVSGSDLNKNTMTERLQSLGVEVSYVHIADNVALCDVVVASTAIADNNIELITARARRIPIVPRAEMLAELMRFKKGIAIAGTHGKTTTTSLTACLLAEAGQDPTYVIGGLLNSQNANAKLGEGKYFIAEADESDASFLHLTPILAVVTNIDRDHMGTYEGDFEKLKHTFIEFIHRLPFYGLAVLCIDDPIVRELIPQISRPIITYGFSEDADIKACNWSQKLEISTFQVSLPGTETLLDITLNLPGQYNTLNALAAIAVAVEVGVSSKAIQNALITFQGINRRFQILGDFPLAAGNFLMIDDYGHHPKEIQAVIDAIHHGWPGRRIVMLYQPHRYSRTKELFDDFATVLAGVDVLLLLEVYAAGEDEIPGADSRSLCSNIRARGLRDPIFISDDSRTSEMIDAVLQDGDILLTQGAGSISVIVEQLLERITEDA